MLWILDRDSDLFFTEGDVGLGALAGYAISGNMERSSSRTALELLNEPQQMRVDDLLSGEDFRELPVVGWPAHPLRLGDVVADAAVRPKLAPQLKGAA